MNPNLPAFVYYFNDVHIHLINDKQMRNSLLNNNSTKSDIISLLSKERTIEENKIPKNIVVDLPFDDWATVSNTKIFITVPRLVHDTFYKLIIQGDFSPRILSANSPHDFLPRIFPREFSPRSSG